MTTELGDGVTPSPANTVAPPPTWPPLPAPLTSINCTVAPATGALVLLLNTVPDGSIRRFALTAATPQPASVATTWSLGSTSRMPSPAATTWVAPFAVGTFGNTRKMPVLGAVSVAAKISVSPVN